MKKWAILLVMLSVIWLWPVGVFWHRISFHPARFTEEWLKLVAAGVILYLLLKLIDEFREKAAREIYWQSLVSEQLVKPLSDLDELLSSLGNDQSRVQLQSQLEKIVQGWRAFRANLALLSTRSDGHGASGRRVDQIASDTRVAELNKNILSAYATIAAGTSLSGEAAGQLVAGVRSLIVDLKSAEKGERR